MNEFARDLEALKQAQPPWMAEGIGVRGNPVDHQRQQTQVNWPSATFTRRSEVFEPRAQAGAPVPKPSLTAV